MTTMRPKPWKMGGVGGIKLVDEDVYKDLDKDSYKDEDANNSNEAPPF